MGSNPRATLAAVLQEALPEIKATVRVRKNPRTDLVRYDDVEHYEERFYFADPSVFEVFSFGLKYGNPQTALSDPLSIVITQAMATKYFGSEDPLGKVLRFENTVDLTVTGLLEDIPTTSHFVFDFLASFESLKQTLGESRLENWAWVDHHTYVLLEEGSDPAAIERKTISLLAERAPDRFSARTSLRLQPLTSIHLHSKLKDEIAPNSDQTYSYILSTVALLILLIACINFINLSTARSARRAKEVGIRKAMGAHRRQLMAQFLGESLVMSLLAFFVAVGLAFLLLPQFNELSGKELAIQDDGAFVVLAFLIVSLMAGMIAGSYPAVYLSASNPTSALRGGPGMGPRKGRLQKVLVSLQFIVSIVLIIATLIISDQLEFFRSTTLGFDETHVIVIPIRDRQAIAEHIPTIKDELKRSPQIVAVSAASGSPGTESHLTFNFRAEGMEEPVRPIYKRLIESAAHQ